jgi:hypothetical protein
MYQATVAPIAAGSDTTLAIEPKWSMRDRILTPLHPAAQVGQVGPR